MYVYSCWYDFLNTGLNTKALEGDLQADLCPWIFKLWIQENRIFSIWNKRFAGATGTLTTHASYKNGEQPDGRISKFNIFTWSTYSLLYSLLLRMSGEKTPICLPVTLLCLQHSYLPGTAEKLHKGEAMLQNPTCQKKTTIKMKSWIGVHTEYCF